MCTQDLVSAGDREVGGQDARGAYGNAFILDVSVAIYSPFCFLRFSIR